MTKRTPRVGIIGAGMSGIGMAYQLRQAGIDSFDLFEKASDLGGTWRANTYPGITCDVPSRYYSYSFAPNPNWSSLFSPGDEIWDYLQDVADRHDVRKHIRFNSEVADICWTGTEWILTTMDGFEARYDFIVSGAGVLVTPRKAEIPGLQDFAGACFHSAEWDHSVPLRGSRIGVIGSGSTGVQIVKALGGSAGHLEHYNRTPQWIVPIANRQYSALTQQLHRRFPALNKLSYKGRRTQFEYLFSKAPVQPCWQRSLINFLVRRYLKKIRDPELRARFTPTDEPLCKRLIIAAGYYEQFERDNVELVDTPIDHVTPAGIVTADGREHPLDVIVLATGFHALEFVRPVELVNETTGAKLSELWSVAPYAYRSIAVPGFPNFLMLIGPHSPLGNQSLFTISESQARYAMKIIELWRNRTADGFAPRAAATERYYEKLRTGLPGTAWVTGCHSWYISGDGLPGAWPFTAKDHRRLLEDIDLDDWELTSHSDADSPAISLAHSTTSTLTL